MVTWDKIEGCEIILIGKKATEDRWGKQTVMWRNTGNDEWWRGWWQDPYINFTLIHTPTPTPSLSHRSCNGLSLQGNRRHTLPAQDMQWMVELWSESRRLDSELVLRTMALCRLRWEASILQASACVLHLLVWSTALLVLGKLPGENFSADLVGRPPSLPVFFFRKPPLRGHCVRKILKWL